MPQVLGEIHRHHPAELSLDKEREYQRLSGQMMVTATLARANLPDSARRLVQRSRGNSEIDPTRDLIYAAAFVNTLLGDTTAAIEALKTYLVVQAAGEQPAVPRSGRGDPLSNSPRSSDWRALPEPGHIGGYSFCGHAVSNPPICGCNLLH
jgi:hypothetical protein